MTRKPENRDSSSWDNVAEWYIGWSGASGSAYHRRIAIPTVMRLLEIQRDQKVLDIGCGPGALARHVVRKEACYVGIDSSLAMIRAARRHHRHPDAEFIHGNASRLSTALKHMTHRFDSAVCLLSIQDMDPVDKVIGQMAHMLRPGGRAVVFMTHPCFRIPRQSGWGWDTNRKLRYRRVDRYLTSLAVPMEPYKHGVGHTKSYHRPLSVYVSSMAAADLTIDTMEEIPVDQDVFGRKHNKRSTVLSTEIPLFLCIRAVKS